MCLRVKSHKRSSSRIFPITSVSISGRLEGLALLLSCEYSYTNSLSKEAVEVEFVFPTPPGATVCGLSGEIDGRQVKGLVREKETARDEYDDAISSGYSAGFVEKQDKDFRLLLGNFSPEGKAVLKIKLLSELQLNAEGVACLKLPAAMLPLCKLNFDLLIERRVGEFSRVESSTHNISYSKEPTGEVVRIVDNTTQNKDLELLLKPSFTDLPHISTFAPISTVASHRYLSSHMCMLTFIPQLAAEAVSHSPTAEFIFIIDRSGSMSGSRIKHAKSTLELLLQSLTIGCYFNIIGFGSKFELLSDGQSLEYNQENLEKSLHYVRRMKANLGGTYLLPPLRAAVQSPEPKPNLPRQIMILTDGDSEAVNEIIEMVRSTPQTFRVFTFGIGSDTSEKLIEGVASAGRGKAVYLKDASEMEQKVLHIMNLAFSPDLRDIQLEFSHPTQFFPAKLPNLFLNERLVVYGFISDISSPDADIEAKLSFSKDGERVVMKKNFSLSPDSVLTSQDEISLVHLLGCSLVLNSWESKPSLQSECVQLSCATGILCKHTAYIAVDTEQSAPISAPLARIPAVSSRTKYGVHQKYRKKRKRSKVNVSSYCIVPAGCSAIQRSRSRSRSRSQSESGSDNEAKASRLYLPENESDDDEDGDIQVDKQRFKREKSKAKAKQENENIEEQMETTSAAIPSTQKTVGSYQCITRLQRAEGSWEYSEELEKELQLDISSTCPSDVSLTLWTSIVCIVCLKVVFSQFQTQLLLVVRKGENWVRQELNKSSHRLSFDELTDSARQIISL